MYRVSDAHFAHTRFKSSAVVAVAHDQIFGVRHAAEDIRPDVEYRVVALISLRRRDSANCKYYRPR